MARTVHRARPVTAVQVPAEVLAAAREAAGGDVTRLQVQPDGSVIVWNTSAQARRMRGRQAP